MNKSTDGWTTVSRSSAATGGGYRRWGDSSNSSTGPSREMPSAFAGGDRNRMSARREEEAHRAWEERRLAAEKERAAKAAAEKQAKIMDFTDIEQYPPLGGGPRAAPAKPKVMNFRDMARDTAARSTLEEAEAAAAAKYRELKASRRVYGGAGSVSTPRLYRHGSYDDGPVDHDFPDEDGYYPPDEDNEYAAAPPPQHYTDEDEDEEEFNSHLAVTRRRGDKSDW